MEKQKTKQRILDAALELFSTQGFEATSIAQIADAVGVRKASLYSHFDSKQDILDRLIDSIMEGYSKHSVRSLADSMDDASAERMAELCEAVGIEPEKLDCYPSQLSGGQCQRFAIARALASSPRIRRCDEPTSALDVLAQARILTLLKTLCSEKNMAMIFVSHDLAVVSSVCDRVLVMKDGRIVEEGAAGSILSCPKHEYTRLLIDSVMGEK